MTGVVLYGINNIFSVRAEGRIFECRIKGKKLRDRDDYNVITAGDHVEIQADMNDPRKASILAVSPRRNALMRWNKKRLSRQIVAANLDRVLCVASLGVPPFRPRFIDRVIVAAESEAIPCSIVVNKVDVGTGDDVKQRIHVYRELGYAVFETSCLTGEGIDQVRGATATGVTATFGQSGAGKSSLIRLLVAGAEPRIGEVSEKYERGRHTTNVSAMWERDDGSCVIDTPGVRELDISHLEPAVVGAAFREFLEPATRCEFSPCTHRHEPECGVREAVARGEIHPDRYESYLRILVEREESQGLSRRTQWTPTR